jgi:hypothetical protein
MKFEMYVGEVQLVNLKKSHMTIRLVGIYKGPLCKSLYLLGEVSILNKHYY